MAGISQGRSVSIGPGEGYESDSVSIPSNGVSAGGFDPSDLFFYGEQGAWYDPSDVKAYTDSAVLGSELVTNGTFDSGTSGWSTPTNATITVVETGSVDIVKTNSTGTSISLRDITTVSGKWYKASFNIKAISGTNVTPYVGVYTTSGVAYPYTVVPIGNTVTFSVYFLAVATLTEVRFGLVDGSAVDNTARFYDVSVKECTSFGVKPKLFQDRAGTTPVTTDGQTVGLILDKSKGLVLGPELVTNGDFSAGNTGWIATGGNTTTFTGGVCHVVGSANSGPYTEVATTPGRSYRITLDAAVVSGVYAVYVWEGGGFATEVAVLGQCISGQFVATTAISRIYIPCWSTPDVTFDNISVRELPGNHAVAPSDAARPLYKTDGTYHWLKFDGVDDTLSTAAIDFTGTHYMSSYVGFSNHLIDLYSNVYAIGDGLQGNVPGGAWMFITDSGYPGFTNQSTTVTSNYIGSSIVGTPGAIPIDTPQVAVGVYDCAGATFNDVVKHIAVDPWDDGKTWTQTGTGFNGTGTYGNLPLIIARAFSRKFNGNIYSLIIRGALSTTDEITNTETWVNSKTGAY